MQRHRAHLLAACAALALSAVACGGQDTPASLSATETTTAPDGDAGASDDLATHQAQARAALAEQLGLDPEADIEVVTAEQVQWRSGALGCPQPDKGYTQAITPGYRIILEADGQTYAFHGAEGDEPFLCEDPEEPAGQTSS